MIPTNKKMASLVSTLETAAVGPAITSRSGTKINSITAATGSPVYWTTPEPLLVPFSATGYGGEQDCINLCLSLDDAAYQLLKPVEDALKALACKTLGLDERDWTPLIKENPQYNSRLLKVKVQRTGSYSTLFWSSGSEAQRNQIDMPEELAQTMVRVRLQIASIWQQGRNFGVSLRATDVECHGEASAQKHECPF